MFYEQAKLTDDSICSLAVMDGLLNNKAPALVIHSWGVNIGLLAVGVSFLNDEIK